MYLCNDTPVKYNQTTCRNTHSKLDIFVHVHSNLGPSGTKLQRIDHICQASPNLGLNHRYLLTRSINDPCRLWTAMDSHFLFRSPTSSPAFRQLWPRCHQDLHLCVTQSFEDLLGRLHSDMSLHFWVNIFLEARQIRQCSSVENEAGISDTTNRFGYCSWLHRFSKQFKVLTSRDRFDIPPRQLEGDALLLLSENDSEVVSFRMMSSSSSNPLYYTSSCSSAHNNHKRHQ